MPYKVRRMRSDDLRGVTEIYNSSCIARESTHGTRVWTVKEMEGFLLTPERSFEGFVCVDGERVVGWTALTPYRVSEDVKHTAELSLFVEEQSRRKGIGATLSHTILTRAPSLDLHCVFALLFEDAPAVVSFAKNKCGFSVVGCIPEIFSYRGKNYGISIVERVVDVDADR